MSNEISWVFKLNDRVSDPLKRMMTMSIDTKKAFDDLNKQWNALNFKKVELTIKADNARQALKDVERDASRLGVSVEELKRLRLGNFLEIGNDLEFTDNALRQVSRSMENLNTQASKTDNNMASRSGWMDKLKSSGKGLTSVLGNQLTNFITDISGSLLPDNINSALNGAINGVMAGLATGNPLVAVIGGVAGGAAGYVGSDIKKETDRTKQRIMFGSNMIQEYLPQLAMSSIDYAANVDKVKVDFKAMLGDESKATDFTEHLQEFELKTPFEFDDLVDTSKNMLRNGFKPEEVTPTLTAVGDAAAGLGLGKEDIDEITSAIIKMKSSEQVTFDQLNPMLDRHVEVWDILSEATGESEDTLRSMVSKGLLPAKETMLALINGMEDRYPNMMKEQSESFDGMLSTLTKGAKQLVLGPLGGGFIDGIKGSMKKFTEFFDLGDSGFEGLKASIQSFGEEVGRFVGGAIEEVQKTFGNLLNDEEFQKKSLPEKFMLLLQGLQEKADEWYENGGASLIESMTNYFTNLLIEVGKSSSFKEAIQDLWLSIAPDSDTLKLILDKMGLGAFSGLLQLFGGKSDVDRVKAASTAGVGSRAIGTGRIPYDGYPIVAHEGERLLTRVEADALQNGGRYKTTARTGRGSINNINISKLTDSIVLSNSGQPAEEQAYRFAELFVQNVCDLMPAYGGV